MRPCSQHCGCSHRLKTSPESFTARARGKKGCAALFSPPEHRALCLREEKAFAELIGGQEGPMAAARPEGCAIGAGSDAGAERAAR